MVAKSGRTAKARREDGKTRKPPVSALGSLPVPGTHAPFYGSDVDFVNGTIVCHNKDLQRALHEFFQFEASGYHSATVVHSLGNPAAAKSSKRKAGTARMLKKDSKAAATDPSTMDGGQVVVDVRC
jgi:hypothetical protein